MSERPMAENASDGDRPPRLAYVPHSDARDHPCDRRRFDFYARRKGLSYEIARPGGDHDVVVLSQSADITTWSRYTGPARLVYDLVDYGCDGMLICQHADLANALPKRDTIPHTADGWFQIRPVVCLLDWEPDRNFEENRILRLLGPGGIPLLSPESPSDTPLLG